jgi:hypothetical protein
MGSAGAACVVSHAYHLPEAVVRQKLSSPAQKFAFPVPHFRVDKSIPLVRIGPALQSDIRQEPEGKIQIFKRAANGLLHPRCVLGKVNVPQWK